MSWVCACGELLVFSGLNILLLAECAWTILPVLDMKRSRATLGLICS